MLILIGEMARGKSAIAKQLNKMGLKSVVTYTTRPPRLGETNGVDYHFIDNADFIRKKNKSFFAETTRYTVNTPTGEKIWRYGTSKDSFKQEGVMIMNPEGVEYVLDSLGSYNDVVVFYVTCSDDIARERLSKRGDNLVEIERRIEQDKIDFLDVDEIKDFTVLNDGSNSIEDIAEMIMIAYEGEVEKKRRIIRKKNEEDFLRTIENHKKILFESICRIQSNSINTEIYTYNGRHEEALEAIKELIKNGEIVKHELERLVEIDAYQS